MSTIGFSETLIGNMALTRIGSTQIIQSFDDGSNEADQLSLWYPIDRDAELTDWPWPFAHKYIALDQVSTQGIPANPEWLYSYRYPSDCLSVRRIVQGTIVTNAQITPPLTTIPNSTLQNNLIPYRQDGDPCPWPFEIGGDSTARLLYTDAQNAWIRYTYQVDDPTQFSPDFVDMLAWRLAKDLYGLARDGSRRDYCEKMYERTKQLARARALNEGQNSQPFIEYNSESIRARQWG